MKAPGTDANVLPYEAKEDAEERGREASPLTRFVAGIPARIGIHVGR